MQSFSDFRFHQLINESNIEGWTKESSRLGTNPGGIYRSMQGDKHYIKFYRNPEQAKSEVAAAEIYHRLGLHTLAPTLVTHGSHLGVASKWREDLSTIPSHEYTQPGMHPELAKVFHAAILTKQWDQLGVDNTNTVRDSKGNLVSADLGGAFRFRAQGGHKDYGPDIAEKDSLRNPHLNPYGHKAFGSLHASHLRDAAQSLRQLHPDEVHSVFQGVQLKDHEAHAQALLGRREALLAHFA